LTASGNYVLQRMLEYASTHRGEGSNAECFFTAIVRSFCQEKGLVTAAQDHRGTFSVQKMVTITIHSCKFENLYLCFNTSAWVFSFRQSITHVVLPYPH
jgi:hypothetical protein